jgi:elongation factor Ts
MTDISAADVKKLRDETGAGFMDVKKALTDAEGDSDKARALLRERGLADAAKRKGRDAKEGLVHAYLHMPTPGLPPRVGVLIEVSTETDFVAKTDDVKTLAQEVAMHICAARPVYLSLEDIPQDLLEEERRLALKKVEGKPEKVQQQASEGAVKKYAKQFALLEQPWVKDEKQTIGQLVASVASKLGENIGVRRFTRFEVAESLD